MNHTKKAPEVLQHQVDVKSTTTNDFQILDDGRKGQLKIVREDLKAKVCILEAATSEKLQALKT